MGAKYMHKTQNILQQHVSKYQPANYWVTKSCAKIRGCERFKDQWIDLSTL